MRARLAAGVIVGVCLDAAACGSPSSPSPVGFNVYGRVLDFSTAAPVSGKMVAFGDIDSGPFRATATATSGVDGSYALTVPARLSNYIIEVDGTYAGLAHPAAPYRGDLFVNVGTCIARYGTVVDSKTARPITGAVVTLVNGNATTDADGWYRLDLGCPSTPPLPGNTTFMYVQHPDYMNQSESIGRGVSGVERRDVSMSPR